MKGGCEIRLSGETERRVAGGAIGNAMGAVWSGARLDWGGWRWEWVEAFRIMPPRASELGVGITFGAEVALQLGDGKKKRGRHH